jgi:hypothetical protein
MAKKLNVPSVIVPSGGSVPVPSFFGLKWTGAERHAHKLYELRQKLRVNGQRIRELEDEVKFQENQLHHQRAMAELNNEGEIDDGYLEKTKKELEKARQRDKDLRLAGEYVLQDLHGEILAHGEEWTQELLAKLQEEDERVAELQEEINSILAGRTFLNGLVEWVSGEKMVHHYTPVEDIRTSNVPRSPESEVISTQNAAAFT